VRPKKWSLDLRQAMFGVKCEPRLKEQLSIEDIVQHSIS